MDTKYETLFAAARRTGHDLRRRRGLRRPRGPLPRQPAPPRRGEAFRHRVPRLQTGGQNRRFARRSPGPHRTLLLAPQRGDRHRECGDGAAVHAADRRGVRLCQRLDGLHRRRPVRIRRRGRNLDPEAPRPGPDGAPRTHDLQVRRFGRRADPGLLRCNSDNFSTYSGKK